MTKYINPNPHEVDLDLGGASRRHAVLAPWAAPKAPGRNRVVELPDDKASFYCGLGMIVKLNADVAKDTPADIDFPALEAAAAGRAERRFPAMVKNDATAEALAAQRERRAAAEAEYRAKEKDELEAAAAERVIRENAQARADLRKESEAGVNPGALTQVVDPIAPGDRGVGEDETAEMAPVTVAKPSGSRMPAAVGVDDGDTKTLAQSAPAPAGSKMPDSVGVNAEDNDRG